jgi:1,4-alpha-glucan branching enzyme
MNSRPVFSIVLDAHLPFIRRGPQAHAFEERCFFEALSETYLPLLGLFDRLDGDHVPFRMGISLSPTLCYMLSDELLINRYLDYTDKQIEFGARELEQCSGNPRLRELVKHFYDQALDRRVLFTGRYEKNILKVFDYYQRKGRIELLGAGATNAFLPFFMSYPEAVQAQFEVAVSVYRSNFGKYPQGFWLPEMGWTPELDAWLRSYNFAYTLVDTHALVFARSFAEKGSFYPAKTPLGVFILGRDFYAAEDLAAMVQEPFYRDNQKDAGYELPGDRLKLFLGPRGGRTGTGYKYWAAGGKEFYDPLLAAEQAREHARSFLKARVSRLKSAGELMENAPCCFCAMEADFFGSRWYEGPQFLEALFREAAKTEEIQLMTPAEYLYKQDSADFQTLVPEFSSWGVNGYAETWLDASNDWIYRHATQALERMIEIAERFPNTSGLKERILNQAAREILLVMSSDWPKMLYKQEFAEYARQQIESSLRNFTTIYEALGSSYISTEWLTNLERKDNIFPHINYRVFRRKR